jgi:excisionase family DNA binding protein
MKVERILLDLDGVLSDFFSEALRRLNEALGEKVLREDYIVDWGGPFHMHEVFDISPARFWEIVEQGDNFWSSLKPFPWAKELLEHCRQHAEVTIATSPSEHPLCAAQKMRWCQEHLGLSASQVMIGSRKYLMAQRNTLLIDDLDPNVRKFRAAGGKAVCVPSNWNTLNLGLADVLTAITGGEWEDLKKAAAINTEHKLRQTGGGDVLLTRVELAPKFGFSVRTLDRLVKQRVIPHVRVGNLVRFRLEDVMAALDRNATVQDCASKVTE